MVLENLRMMCLTVWFGRSGLGFARLFGYGKYVLLPISSISVEMMGLIGMGNNPMVGATVAVAVEISMTLNK